MRDDSRKHIRIKVQTRVYVEVDVPPPGSDEKGKLVLCDVIDVSFGGLSAIIDQELIVGSILSLAVELPSAEREFFLVGEVMWCRSVNDQHARWAAGFQLMKAHGSDIGSWRELLEYV